MVAFVHFTASLLWSHTDLVTENVMIVGANFKKFKNGTVLIVGRPKAILIDFGVAEVE